MTIRTAIAPAVLALAFYRMSAPAFADVYFYKDS